MSMSLPAFPRASAHFFELEESHFSLKFIMIPIPDKVRGSFIFKELPNLPTMLVKKRLGPLGCLERLPSSMATLAALKELHIECRAISELPRLPASLIKHTLENLPRLETVPQSIVEHLPI